MDITLFELHFDRGINFGSQLAEHESEEPEPDESVEVETPGTKRSRAGTAKKGIVVLFVLGLLGAVAIAVKKLGGSPPEELEDVDELAEQF